MDDAGKIRYYGPGEDPGPGKVEVRPKPSCNRCYGTGYIGTRGDERLTCSCLRRPGAVVRPLLPPATDELKEPGGSA